MNRKLFSLAKTPMGDLIIGIAFGKLSKILPVRKVKETEKVIAFWHPKPYWEKHILIVPKKAIKKLTLLKKEDNVYINEVFKVVKEIVEELGWEDEGYTLLVNGGKKQEVGQLHFHLSNGKKDYSAPKKRYRPVNETLEVF